MVEPLSGALAQLRELLLDSEQLVKAVASGKQRGAVPAVPKVQLRPVQLKNGPHLQVVSDGPDRPRTDNYAWGPAAAETVRALLAEPYGNWHVQTTAQTLQLRVTKRGEAQVHRETAAVTTIVPAQAGTHDRQAEHLLDPADPLFAAIGGSAAKRRQVDAFLRAILATIGAEQLPERLTIADLGCGNAYLTFAAYQYLTRQGIDVTMVGVDIRADQRDRNTALAQQLGIADQVSFVAATIGEAEVSPTPDLVLALHACDTATDQALARAVGWEANWILAAPCCHHELAEQLRRSTQVPAGAKALLRDGILRERHAAVLTDALRAALLRSRGYRVDVVEFVDPEHTPRNTLIRARHTGHPADLGEYQQLSDLWGVSPALAALLSA